MLTLLPLAHSNDHVVSMPTEISACFYIMYAIMKEFILSSE